MRTGLLLLLASIVPSAAWTQTTPDRAAAPAAAEPGDSYVYQSEGRRDPFVNPLKSNPEARAAAGLKRPGPSGMSVGEISVRGVLQSRGSMVAMIQGPDNKTYVVHEGDKLLDGTIKTISARGLVVDQEISDPLSIAKHRDVTRLLRSLEAAKE
jgi:Tfp pilus assembly protein PilP